MENQEKYERLSGKDKGRIQKIIEKGKKQPRKKTFTPRWLYSYLDRSYKDWDYDKLDDNLDMLEVIAWLAKQLKINPRPEIKYIIENFFIGCVDRASKMEISRFKRLTKSWGISIRMQKKILTDDDFDRLYDKGGVSGN